MIVSITMKDDKDPSMMLTKYFPCWRRSKSWTRFFVNKGFKIVSHGRRSGRWPNREMIVVDEVVFINDSVMCRVGG